MLSLPVLAFAAALPAAGDWVPMRWPSSDPRSLDLLSGTPVNCLLLEPRSWSAEFSAAAASQGIVTLGVIRPDQAELAARAGPAGLNGVVLEGVFDKPVAAGGLTVIEMPPRARLRFDPPPVVLATSQGVWPGIDAAEEESKAAPSGAPWIHTNSGFLRFVRAMTTAPVWMGCQPPPGVVFPAARYLQAVGDAAITGARWVISLDQDLNQRLLARDPPALRDWNRIASHVHFFEQHREWRRMELTGGLALVQDTGSGGLLSGGILDMIAVKHTPVRAVPGRYLDDTRMRGARMAVNVDPAALDEARKETLRRFTRGGGTLLTAPPGWKFPPPRDDRITLDKEDIAILDSIWREISSMTGRHNLGVRLFNVASTLSTLSSPAAGRPLVLQLVNYSDYPVENITAHILGRFTRADLYEPGGAAPKKLAPYESEDGTGVDIDRVSTVAALVLE